MTISQARTFGQSGALFEISGTVPTNATWSEDIYFSEAALPMDLTGLAFKMTFRRDMSDTSAEFTLSTADGTLAIAEDTDAGANRILRINVADGLYSGYYGEYICDIASEDGDGKVILWAHGIVTLASNPVVF